LKSTDFDKERLEINKPDLNINYQNPYQDFPKKNDIIDGSLLVKRKKIESSGKENL